MVDSCLHRKFRNGAWRPRAAFQDRVLSFEDRIIYIDYIWLIFCVVLITLLHGLLMMNVYSNCMLN